MLCVSGARAAACTNVHAVICKFVNDKQCSARVLALLPAALLAELCGVLFNEQRCDRRWWRAQVRPTLARLQATLLAAGLRAARE